MKATKAADNPYYKARIAAARYNDHLRSREGAADALGLHPSTLASYELGTIKVMQPDAVVLMADLYNAPELLRLYCAQDCPIGFRLGMEPVDSESGDRITIELMAALDGSEDVETHLLRIMADGVVDASEEEQLKDVIARLDRLVGTVEELKLWASKHTKGRL